MIRRVLITGSRHWTDEEPIAALLDSLPDDAVIIVGDCPTGTDAIVLRLARRRWPGLMPYKADWNKFGKAAGPLRNQQMIDEGKPTEAHGFVRPDSKGTWDCLRRCGNASVPMTITKATRCPKCQKHHPAPKGMQRKLCAYCAAIP